MPEVPENTALAELLGAIADRRIRRKVQKLLQFGEEAVRALGELDLALYLREDGEEQLQIVSDAVLSHFRRLMDYLAMVAPKAEAAEDGGGAVELELDPGESAPVSRASGPIRPSGIIAQRQKSDEDKWGALAAEMDTLQYGLGSELREFDRRFSVALKQDRKEQAVADLNDATTSLMDGVFAVMTTVYECFLGHAEPERMVPGHRDTLGKALAVRRALAELRREVQALNRTIQDRSAPAHLAEQSYRRVVEAMVQFIGRDVFFYLRSDSRKEFERFRETLESGTAARNRNDCEGFDKYLDSLAFVSKRGVLIKHDTDLQAKITTDLERALKFAAVVPEIAIEVIQQSFVKGERLLGLNDNIDAVVQRWLELNEEQRAEIEIGVPLGRRLLELVRPAETPKPPDGDFL